MQFYLYCIRCEYALLAYLVTTKLCCTFLTLHSYWINVECWTICYSFVQIVYATDLQNANVPPLYWTSCICMHIKLQFQTEYSCVTNRLEQQYRRCLVSPYTKLGIPAILHRGLQLQNGKHIRYDEMCTMVGIDPDEKLNLNLEAFAVGCGSTAARPGCILYVCGLVPRPSRLLLAVEYYCKRQTPGREGLGMRPRLVGQRYIWSAPRGMAGKYVHDNQKYAYTQAIYRWYRK